MSDDDLRESDGNDEGGDQGAAEGDEPRAVETSEGSAEAAAESSAGTGSMASRTMMGHAAPAGAKEALAQQRALRDKRKKSTGGNATGKKRTGAGRGTMRGQPPLAPPTSGSLASLSKKSKSGSAKSGASKTTAKHGAVTDDGPNKAAASSSASAAETTGRAASKPAPSEGQRAEEKSPIVGYHTGPVQAPPPPSSSPPSLPKPSRGAAGRRAVGSGSADSKPPLPTNVRPTSTPAEERAEHTVELSLHDFELIAPASASNAGENQLDDPSETRALDYDEEVHTIDSALIEPLSWGGPQKSADAPAFAPSPVARLAEPEPLSAAPPLADDRQFFLREATALAAQQPERGASMWLEAARAADRAGAESDAVASHLQAALDLSPESPHLLTLCRRMLLRLRRYDRAFEVIERESGAGGEPQVRLGALIEAAALSWLKNGDRDRARELLGRALDVQPAHPIALAFRVALDFELSRLQEAADGLQQLAGALSTPDEQASALFTAGALLATRLGRPEEAENILARAAKLDPHNVLVFVGLTELQLQRGQWAELCQTLEQLAQLELSQATAARLYMRAGSLHLDRTGDLEAAQRALFEASRCAPQWSAPVTRLGQAYEAMGRHAELVDSLRKQVSLTIEAPVRAALLARIGWLLQAQLGQIDEAVEAYGMALEAQPGYLPALQALGTIYRQRGEFERLLAIVVPETESTASDDQRSLRCVEAAEILVEQLARPDDAIALYRRALEIEPGNALAFWGLRRLLRAAQRYRELAELYAQQLESFSDLKTRQHLLLALARLQAGPLQAPEEALDTLNTARQVSASRTATIELIDLHEQLGRDAELVELLLSEAGDTRDPSEAKGRQLQAAAILEQRLGESERALSVLSKVLESDPRSGAAARAAGRIYHRQGRWKDLVALHRHELDVDPERADAPQLLCRIGRIYEELLGQPAEAIDVYMEALERDAGCSVALHALERLVRTEERYGELIDVLMRYAATRTDPQAAADVACRAAEIADHRLDKPRRAAKLYSQVLEQFGDVAPALRGQLDLQLRQKRYAEAAKTLQRLAEITSDAGERGYLELQLTQLRELRLEQPPALEPYARATQDSALGSRLRGELLRVARATQSDALAETLHSAGKQTSDAGLACARLLEAAYRSEFSQEGASHLEPAVEAFGRRSEEPAVLWSLGRALAAAGRWGDLASLLESEAAITVEPALRLQLITQACGCHLRAGQNDEAARLARQSLTVDRHHLPALRMLVTLHEQRTDKRELASWLDQLAEASANGENRRQACLRAGDLWTELGDNARALASLQPALADDPGQPDAFARAERLLSQMGDFARLSQLYTRRIRSCSDEQQRVELLRLHARLLRQKLQDMAGAAGELSELLVLAPRDLPALIERAELLCAQHRWSDAVEALEQVAEISDDRDSRQQARQRLAQIWLEHLHEHERAGEVLQQALAEDPEDSGAKQLLVQVSVAEGKWQRARELLEQLAVTQQPKLQVWALTQLAEVARIGLRDEQLQQQSEREALTMGASSDELLAHVAESYAARGRQQRFVELAEQIIRETTDSAVAAKLRLAAAKLLLDDLQQGQRALELVREVLVVSPGDSGASLILGRALEQRGDHEAAAAAYRRLLQHDITNAQAHAGLARLMGVLGDPAVAGGAASVLALLGEADVGQRAQVDASDRQGAPTGRLEVASMPVEPELRPLRELFISVMPHLANVYPVDLPSPLGSSSPAVAIAARIAEALGAPATKVGSGGAAPALASPGTPVRLLLAERVAQQPQSALFRFWAGRALAGAITGGALAERLSDGELADLLAALTTSRPIDPSVQQLRKQVSRALPRKLRKQVESLELPHSSPQLWQRFREAERARADRIGLLCCSNPLVALEELSAGTSGAGQPPLSSPRARALAQYAISEEYGQLYRRLWA